MHCSASDTLLGKAPVWLSCIILMIIGGLVGAVGGAVGMLFRTRKLQRAKYTADNMPLSTACQPAAVMQAPDSAYKSRWRAAPSGSQSGHGIPTLSGKATSLIEDQKVGKGPLDQRLLQEDAIRRSGVSGPLGMGVVMQSISKEAGQLYPGASPQPQSASTGYSRGASTSHTATGTQMAAEDTEHRAMGDGSRIGALHRQSDAKENIASALNPAYGHEKIVAEQSPARGPADRSYALQAIQNSNNAGAAMGGHTVAASRGPAMLNSDMRYVEYSSTPPLAAADSPVAQPRFSPGASAGGQYMPPPAAMRPAQSPADRTNLPMAPQPPRPSTAGGPPPPPPPPAQLRPAVRTSGTHVPPSQGQNARSPAPPPPPPPPPQQGIVSMRGAPPPPPPPPPPRGSAGQPSRAPPPPSRPAQLRAGNQQEQGSSSACKQSNGGGTGMASIAEQAAQCAANRGKPPVAQVAQSQQRTRFAQTGPAQAGPASLGKGPVIATASAAHRHAPSEAYELEDLDEDWVAMLNMLDSRLLEVGRPTMMAKERAVAVRSLLVSTCTEKPDVALQKAIEDIERYRRIH